MVTIVSYKLICFDLDGTLLNSKHQISEQTLTVLRNLEKIGVKLAIVTGRPGYDSKHHAMLISNNTYYIGSNGAVVGSVKGNQIISEVAFKQKHLKTLMHLAVEHKIKPVLFTSHQTIIHGTRDYLLHLLLFRMTHNHLKFIPKMCQLTDFMHQNTGHIQKVVFFIFNHKKALALEKVFKAFPEFEVARTSNICFEVTEKGINKSFGLKKLVRHLNIHQDEVMAFGDSENDRAMLLYAGHGVAMGNAPPAIQSIADKVTDTNDQGGVIKELKTIFKHI